MGKRRNLQDYRRWGLPKRWLDPAEEPEAGEAHARPIDEELLNDAFKLLRVRGTQDEAKAARSELEGLVRVVSLTHFHHKTAPSLGFIKERLSKLAQDSRKLREALWRTAAAAAAAAVHDRVGRGVASTS
jgi:hypothetical protein